MNNSISITPRRLLVIGLFGLLAVLSYGFAAANTVPASNAGDGAALISGYTVTNVHYTLNGTTPTQTTNVSFTLAPALPLGGVTRVSIDNGVTWIAAANCTGTTNISCTAAVPVTSLTNLRVVAAQ